MIDIKELTKTEYHYYVYDTVIIVVQIYYFMLGLLLSVLNHYIFRQTFELNVRVYKGRNNCFLTSICINIAYAISNYYYDTLEIATRTQETIITVLLKTFMLLSGDKTN